MLRKRTCSVGETERFAEAFAARLHPGDIVAFRGGLGAGKTAFTRGLAAGLRVRDEVSSPTFALVNEYRGDIPLVHFDMYRIQNADDLYMTGFFDYLEGDGVVAIEWSENITDALPEETVFVTLSVVDEHTRDITVEVKGEERFADLGD